MNQHIDVDDDRAERVGDIVSAAVKAIGQDMRYDGGKITKAGTYAGVEIDRYHRDTTLFDGFSISSSGLRTLLQRPLEYWWTSPYNPEAAERYTSPSLEFGKAAHMLLLGEQGFAERYVKRPETYETDKGEWKPWSGNSKVCKEWLADQAKAGKTVITETEITHIRNMADALSCNEAIRLGILNGRIERSIFYRDHDIWLKARPDAIPADSGDFVDLKTAASVDDESLSRAIFSNGYHVQAGFMRKVVRAVLGADAFTSFTFVFVEKTAPYDVRVMQLKDSDIDRGEAIADRGLALLRQCIERGRWPGFDGFDQQMSFIEMPAWARTRIDTELQQKAA